MKELLIIPNFLKNLDLNLTSQCSLSEIQDLMNSQNLCKYINLFLINENKILLTYDEGIIESPRSFDIKISHNPNKGESELILYVFSSKHSSGSMFSYNIVDLDVLKISSIYRDITKSEEGQEVFIINYRK